MSDAQSDLIARLEAASVGSRELDALVWYRVFEPDVDYPGIHTEQTEQGPREVLTCELGSKWADDVGHHTTSLDAAVALVERVATGWMPGISKNVHHETWCAWLGRETDDPSEIAHIIVDAETPALALCIALLKAIPAASHSLAGDEGDSRSEHNPLNKRTRADE